jgi:two-component system osmolarity sensor histidine kinase EnvZ
VSPRPPRAGPSLAGQTARTLAIAFVAFMVVTVAAIVWFMMVPMARRSADDLAALMMLSAQTWTELPPQTRGAFETELIDRHNLWIEAGIGAPLETHAHSYPYLLFLEDSLSHRTGQSIHVKLTDWEETWFWVELPVGDKTIRVGFPRSRIGVQPPLAGLTVLLAGLLLSLLTARTLARRITGPLARMAEATAHVGQGEEPALLPESGPTEIAHLARSFNRMALEVRELLANRTTLLAGISHDLRSPLARMRVALEMLPAETSPRLVARLTDDMEEMNRLIGVFLELAQGLQHEERQELEIGPLLEHLAQGFRDGGAQVECRSADGCRVHAGAMTLRRVLGNLVENAVRYGDGGPVDIECARMEDGCCIRVLDRGPGIPEDQREAVFRPFHRLETSRSKSTGGSGLGLAIARQLAQVNGWRLDLHDRHGGGLEARLEIPRLVTEGTTARAGR